MSSVDFTSQENLEKEDSRGDLRFTILTNTTLNQTVISGLDLIDGSAFMPQIGEEGGSGR